jgi:hypothetical protein
MLRIATGEWEVGLTDPPMEGTIRVHGAASVSAQFGSSEVPDEGNQCAFILQPVDATVQIIQDGDDDYRAASLHAKEALVRLPGVDASCVTASFSHSNRRSRPDVFLLCEDGRLWFRHADEWLEAGRRL